MRPDVLAAAARRACMGKGARGDEGARQRYAATLEGPTSSPIFGRSVRARAHNEGALRPWAEVRNDAGGRRLAIMGARRRRPATRSWNPHLAAATTRGRSRRADGHP